MLLSPILKQAFAIWLIFLEDSFTYEIFKVLKVLPLGLLLSGVAGCKIVVKICNRCKKSIYGQYVATCNFMPAITINKAS